MPTKPLTYTNLILKLKELGLVTPSGNGGDDQADLVFSDRTSFPIVAEISSSNLSNPEERVSDTRVRISVRREPRSVE